MVRVFALNVLGCVALAAGVAAAQAPNREPVAAAAFPQANPAQPAPQVLPGQPVPAPSAPGQPAMTTPATAPHLGGVVESKLGPIYVRDQNGTLVPYPSITLEELDRLQEIKQRQRSVEPPRFAFSSGASIAGSVHGDAVELEVKFPIQINKSAQPEEDWVRIPLRLNQAFLLPQLEHTGPGEFLVEFIPKGDGYVVWLTAQAGSSHTFKFHLKAPLLRKNASRQLILSTPDTPTSLRLVVPGNGNDARINGNVGNILTTHRGPAGQTELTVDAAGGDIDLTWRELDELPPVLAAFGNIVISFDGRRYEFDAQLNVRSYGPPIDSFTIRLPPGTELIGTNQFTQPGLEYALLPDSGGNGAGRRVLVKRVEGKTAGLIEARLRCQSTSTMDTAARWQPLGGFEVVEARHQKGTVDFQVDGDWSIDWQLDANIRRVDDLPEIARQQRLAARFEYDRQPHSLQTLIREKETRITVEPMWLVSVEAQRLNLEGTLKYRISGARAKPLKFDTGGWTIQQVTPAELAGTWQVTEDSLTVPLSATVPSGAGEFELQIRATREHNPTGRFAAAAAQWPRVHGGLTTLDLPLPPLGPGSVLQWKLQEQNTEVSFPLPRPVADAGLSALVIVSPDDNIELSPNTEQLRSLVNDTLPPEIKPTRQQQPLVYREDVGGEPAVFVGQFRVRRQSIAVTIDSRVRIEDRDFAVEQRFVHAISYVPASQLRYLVPRNLVESGRLEVLLDGVATSWTRLATESAAPQIPITVDLRDPHMGSCEVVFRFRQARERQSDAAPLEVRVALIQIAPDDTWSIDSSRLRIVAPANLAVTLSDGDWSAVAETAANVAPGEIQFESSDLPADVAISLSPAANTAKRSTDVQRVWVQTLLTVSERRDRACFRLTTNEQSLTFQLPRGVILDDLNYITVAINGQPVDRFSVLERGEVRLELGEAIGSREATVELWYWFAVQPVPLGRVSMQAPQLAGASRAERVYWQILLPRHEHLAWYPAEWTSENSWQRERLWWSRHPHRSQADLEKWVSASSQPDLVQDMPAGFNVYLFSSMGPTVGRSVITVTRQLAVFGVAGVVLLSGALLLYLPVLRHPLLLLAVGVFVGAFALVFPEPALAAAQLIALGMALVLVAGMVMSLVARPVAYRPAVRLVTSSAVDSRSSRQTMARAPATNSHVTTTSLPPSVPLSAAGNEP